MGRARALADARASGDERETSRLREAAGVLSAAAGAYALVSLLSYHPFDPSFNSSVARGAVQNAGGVVGAYLADLLVQLLGVSSYSVVALAFATGARLIFGRPVAVRGERGLASAGLLVAASILLQLWFGPVTMGGHRVPAGGLLGHALAEFLVRWIDVTGSFLLASSILVVSSMVLTGTRVSDLLVRGAAEAAKAWRWGKKEWIAYRAASAPAGRTAERKKMEKPARRTKPGDVAPSADDDAAEEAIDEFEPSMLDIVRQGAAEEAAQRLGVAVEGPRIVAPGVYGGRKGKGKEEEKEKLKEKEQEKEKGKGREKGLEVPAPVEGVYALPSIELLESEDQKPMQIDAEALKSTAEVLERKLKDFGVFGRVVEVHPGPVITMFEFEPAPGIKVNRVSNLVDDLKMAMKATSVRIVAPIPGKGTVGIEIPNDHREMVYLKDILASAEFTERATMTPMALGKDIAGKPVMADLAKMPHLLVAGTTGSGKSVSVNAMILSLLYRSTPNDVRMVMIDPKMLEFSIYDGIPHLLLPVITNPKKAAMALKWAVTEMERRYRLLADVNARNIAAYNKRIPRILEERKREAVDQTAKNDPMDGAPSMEAQAEEAAKPLEHGHLPYIVIVIDELSDLMMIAKNEVEESITRLAQMARAAGIHLLIATQRPSVDVITGLIKANFPARIAFRVLSKIDSRTVLDASGAEALLGDGDMLFLQPGTTRMSRVHGAFVSDTEIQRVVDFLKAQGKPQYEEEILRASLAADAGTEGSVDEEADELYDQAVAIVAESRQASISYIQRRLKVGYNRAARMIERMETEGIVGASDGVKPRPVLVQHIPGPQP